MRPLLSLWLFAAASALAPACATSSAAGPAPSTDAPPAAAVDDPASPAAAPPDDPAPARAWPAGLAFWQAADGACALMLRPHDGGETRPLFALASCPRTYALDAVGGRLLSLDDEDTVWLRTPGADPVPLGTVAGAQDVYFAKGSRTPRVTALATAGIDFSPSQGADEMTVHVEVTEGGHTQGYDNVFAPPWGVWAMARAYEARADGLALLQAVPTKTDAGDTPGLSALDAAHLARDAQSAQGGDARCADPSPVTEDAAARFRGAMKLAAEAEVDGCGLGPKTLMYAVEWGDAPHPWAPFALCDEAGCARLPVGEGQYGVLSAGEYVLFAPSLPSDETLLFSASAKNPAQAIWRGQVESATLLP